MPKHDKSYIELKTDFVRFIYIFIAYLQRGSDNIVVLDWSAFAFGNYVSVALRIKDISKFTAKALSNLATSGLNVDTLHIIGHSLGAQVAGFIGRYLDFTIPRVTGTSNAIINSAAFRADE